MRVCGQNVLWGAPRLHGELLRLGFAVAQSTVAKYMVKRGGPSGQTWGPTSVISRQVRRGSPRMIGDNVPASMRPGQRCESIEDSGDLVTNRGAQRNRSKLRLDISQCVVEIAMRADKPRNSS